jgi:Tfp pilus assembly protein PilO
VKTGINSRDKKLLMLLGVVAIAFAIYYFALSPQLDKYNNTKAQLETIVQEHARISQAIESVDALREEENKQRMQLTDKYKTFFYEINEERILHRLDTLFIGANLTVSDYQQTIPEADEIAIIKSDYTPLNYPLLDLARKVNPTLAEDVNASDVPEQKQQESKDIPEDALPTMGIKLGFIGTNYNSIMNFMRSLESLDRSVVISNILIKKEEESSNLEGEIVLTVYSLPKLDESETSDLVFQPGVAKGKTNPFQ